MADFQLKTNSSGGYHLTIMQIEIFLACYQVRNYSKVARMLGYTPSAISKTIQNIENTLDLQLFLRQYHELIPTPIADVLAHEWAPISGIVDRGIERANAIKNRFEPVLRMGIISHSNFVVDYLAYKPQGSAHKALRDMVRWEPVDMRDVLPLLEEKFFDLAIVGSRYMNDIERSQYQWERIFTSPEAVFIPEGHPLFDREITSFGDFKDYPFIILNPDRYPHNYDWLMSLCAKHNFLPKISVTCVSVESAQVNLIMGQGLYLANSLQAASWESKTVRMFRLTEEEPSSLLIVWRKDNPKPEIPEIVKIMTH